MLRSIKQGAFFDSPSSKNSHKRTFDASGGIQSSITLFKVDVFRKFLSIYNNLTTQKPGVKWRFQYFNRCYSTTYSRIDVALNFQGLTVTRYVPLHHQNLLHLDYLL